MNKPDKEEKPEEDLLSQKEIEILVAQMPEEIQSEIADICIQADDLSHAKKYSKIIKDKLDKKHGKGWNVIIGDSFAGSCSVAKGTLLQMKIAGVLILVFKSSMLVKDMNKKV
ncbi:dynein axonemal light chain 4 [Nematocida sp. AWRm80]|nr:dynein axonemal light chain 4 [Nematocida sp. AWRm80]